MTRYIRNPKQVTAGLGVDMLNGEARNMAFDVIPKLLPTVSLGLNDYHQTHLLWEATNRQTLMLFRHVYDPYDDQWWHWKTKDWKNHYTQVDDNVKQFGKDYSRDLVHLFLNEPKDITNRADQWIDFVLDMLHWGKNNGFRFAFPIPNVEVGWDALMVQGKFDRLLKAYDDEKFREHGHIGFIHEYTLFHINEGLAASRKRGGWDAMWPDAFLHPDKMTPDNWATKDEVESLWASNYTLCRGMRVNKRMATLEREPIPLVRTEGWWDKLPHLQEWIDPRTDKKRNFYNETLARYNVQPPSPHTAFAGAASLEPLYRKMLTYIDWSKEGAFADSIVDQIKHVHEVEPDYYLGTCWFQLDPGDPRWDINGGYSPHRIPHIWQKLYDWRDELKGVVTPPPPTEPPPPVSDLPADGWYDAHVLTEDEPANIYSAERGGAILKVIPAQTRKPARTIYMAGSARQPIDYEGVKGWVDEFYGWFEPAEPPFTIEPGDARWKPYRFFTNGQTAIVYKEPLPKANLRIADLHVGGVVVDHIPYDLLTAVEKTYVDRAQGTRWAVVQLSVAGIGFVREREVTRREPMDAPVDTVPKPKYDELKQRYDELQAAHEQLKKNLANHAAWKMAAQTAYGKIAEGEIDLHQLMHEESLKETAQ